LFLNKEGELQSALGKYQWLGLKTWVKQSGVGQISSEGSFEKKPLGGIISSFDPNLLMEATWIFFFSIFPLRMREQGLSIGS